MRTLYQLLNKHKYNWTAFSYFKHTCPSIVICELWSSAFDRHLSPSAAPHLSHSPAAKIRHRQIMKMNTEVTGKSDKNDINTEHH